MSISLQKFQDAKKLLEEKEELNSNKATIETEKNELLKKIEELKDQYEKKNLEMKKIDSKLKRNEKNYMIARKIIKKYEYNMKVIAENKEKEIYARKCLFWIKSHFPEIKEYNKDEIFDIDSPSGLDNEEKEFYDFLLTYFESGDSSTFEELTFDTLHEKYGESTSDIIIESAHLMSFKVKKFPYLEFDEVFRKSEISGMSSTKINATQGLPKQIVEYYIDKGSREEYEFSWWRPFLNSNEVYDDYKNDCIAYKNENDFTIDTTLNDFTFSSIDLFNIKAVADGDFTHSRDQ